uniref:Putative 4-hydroxy-4-methyl-2-oxoglutarate aldolase n=1 Tax=Streptomyces fradiae TaxID=1906 RepID=D2SNE5_STRFR|nr:demethylmenaquinone methyltransferase-like protein [Streptomyces fradiae]
MNGSVPPELVSADTAAVSDALDMLRLDGCLPGLLHFSGHGFVAGPAFTVRYGPVGEDESGPAGDFIDDVPAGAVVVVANSGRTDATVWGDVLSRVARHRGVAGTVIDGVCRDIGGSRAVDHPVWARGVFMRSGKNRVRLREVGGVVRVGDVRVFPGDLVCADESGVVVVPRERATEVGRLVADIRDREERIVAAVLAGQPLAAARQDFGYHQLSRPVERLRGGTT